MSKLVSVVALFASCCVNGAVADVSEHDSTQLQDVRRLQTSPFLEENGLVVMEMESQAIKGDWKFETSAWGYTGSGYYRMDGNTVYTGDPNGRTNFRIRITNPGEYRLAIRSYKNHHDSTLSNDCYTKMIGHAGYQSGDIKTYMFGPSYIWSWSTIHQLSHDDHRLPVYSLWAGTHTLQVSGRAKGFAIDRIVLYKEETVPQSFATDLARPESPRWDGSSPAPPSPPPPPPTAAPIQPMPPPIPDPTRAPVPEPTEPPIPAPTKAPVWVPAPDPTPAPVWFPPSPAPVWGWDAPPAPTPVVWSPPGAFIESGGLVVMEMESQWAVPDWVFEAKIPGYTGTGYYRMDGNEVFGGDPNGRTSFFLQIHHAGTYRLAIRSYKNRAKQGWGNDCYTKMVGYAGFQGEDTKTFMSGNRFEWSWNTWHQPTSGAQWPQYYLEAGTHELQISGRSSHFHIDRIVLYDTVLISEAVATDISKPESERVGSEPQPAPTYAPIPEPTSKPVLAPTPWEPPPPTPTPPTPPTNPSGGNDYWFVELNGLLVIEMESEDPVPHWVYETGVAGYTGTGYHRMDGNDDAGSDFPNGRISFFIEITTPGTYRLAIRSYKNNERTGASNDCFTRMVGHEGYQGTDTKTYMPGPSYRWSWNTWHEPPDGARWPQYDLEVGLHEFQISGRSKNFHVDRFVFFKLGSHTYSAATDTNNAESPRFYGDLSTNPNPPPSPPADDEECALGEAIGDVFGGAEYFSDGQTLPAGTYRIEYVDGCMKYNYNYGWTIHGTANGFTWWIVDGSDPPNKSSPGVKTPGTVGFQVATGAYTYYQHCVNSNSDFIAPMTFELTADTKLGIWLEDTTYWNNLPGPSGRGPRWQLTLLAACPSWISPASSECLIGDAGNDDTVYGNVDFFFDGQALPAGTYRIEYLDGCMKYDPTQAWTVNARDDWFTYWLVTDGSTPDKSSPGQRLPGTIGFWPGDGGYEEFVDCTNVNKDLEVNVVTFELPTSSPLGVWLEDNEYFNNIPGINGNSPRWRLTLLSSCDALL